MKAEEQKTILADTAFTNANNLRRAKDAEDLLK